MGDICSDFYREDRKPKKEVEAVGSYWTPEPKVEEVTASRAKIVDPEKYYKGKDIKAVAVVPSDWKLDYVAPPKPDGGPAEYYDIPPNTNTLNDVIEWKGDTSWKGDSFHLGNILKAAWRWGIKEGTTKEYDARKFMYSGARLLMKYAGVASVRKTLQQMLDDPQFKDK